VIHFIIGIQRRVVNLVGSLSKTKASIMQGVVEAVNRLVLDEDIPLTAFWKLQVLTSQIDCCLSDVRGDLSINHCSLHLWFSENTQLLSLAIEG